LRLPSDIKAKISLAYHLLLLLRHNVDSLEAVQASTSPNEVIVTAITIHILKVIFKHRIELLLGIPSHVIYIH
jgi:hypothetical protein